MTVTVVEGVVLLALRHFELRIGRVCLFHEGFTIGATHDVHRERNRASEFVNLLVKVADHDVFTVGAGGVCVLDQDPLVHQEGDVEIRGVP